MPTKRVKLALRPIEAGDVERYHLQAGSCLIGCSLCDDGMPEGLHVDLARRVWTEQQEQIVREWPYNAFFPPFAAVAFGGAPWPDFDSAWPENAQRHWKAVNDALGCLRAD